MVATPSAVIDIPISRIKVTTRLRATDPDKVRDLTESISGVGLLHAITVSRRGDDYLLLAGNHRLESAKSLNWETIPATIQEADLLIDELIEVEENLIKNSLSPLQEANHLVRWEELLT